MATYRQRIYQLFEAGEIDDTKKDELLKRQRHASGSLDLVKTKLGESFSEFRSRAYEVAQCRGRQHWWDESYEFSLGYLPIGAVYTESALCVRCGKTRITLVNAIGKTDRHIYIDPSGFSLEGVKTTKADWKALARYIELGMILDQLEAGEEKTAKVVSIKKRTIA